MAATNLWGDYQGPDGFTGAAGVLRTNVAQHEETRGFDIELLTHVLSDLDQVAPTLAAGAGFRLVPLFDARQVRGQGLAAGTATGLGREPFNFGLNGTEIGVPGFFKQLTLLGRERFALVREAEAFVVGQIQGKGGDFEVFVSNSAASFWVRSSSFCTAPDIPRVRDRD